MNLWTDANLTTVRSKPRVRAKDEYVIINLPKKKARFSIAADKDLHRLTSYIHVTRKDSYIAALFKLFSLVGSIWVAAATNITSKLFQQNN